MDSKKFVNYIRQSLRPLLMDGAMGSLLQDYRLTEEDFRGTLFGDVTVQLKGNNDVLSLTRPDVVRDVHRRYLEAGADLITTNTFSSQRVSQQEYHLSDQVENLNAAAARIAREEADRMTALTPDQPRFVLGDIGPTSRMLSMSDDVNDPAARSLTFDELEGAYLQQMTALVEGGVDALLVETIFDTLNAKAAISAYLRVLETMGKTRDDLPLMLSMTVSDASGRTLSGQTIEAFITSTAHAHPLSVGMNCGLGAEAMVPYLRRMRIALQQSSRQGASPLLSCHPNAGLPNQFGGYDDTPEDMVAQIGPMLQEGLVEIVGGCCGTTPEHIRAMAELIRSVQPLHSEEASATVQTKTSSYSGLESFAYGPSDFVVTGERCNVAGSRKFLRLINKKQYDEALDIARTQIEKGAMVVDVNMDDGLLDAEAEMRTFLNLLASDPSICRVPLMIDSSRFAVIETGLKCSQGKCIVNSISLKQGETEFLRQARICHRLGAAVIVMCFDEEGQATDYDRRIAICQRAYRLLTEEVGMEACDIIFDPNVLTIATGMAEHAYYARDFIRATEWISRHLPGTRVSGGLSNLSFAFRGNNYVREAMHAVFLHHAKAVGMSMAIMNPATALRYESLPDDLRQAITDVILPPEAAEGETDTSIYTERLMEIAARILAEKEAAKAAKAASGTPAAPAAKATALETPEQRLQQALLKGITTTLEADLSALLARGDTPLQIISGPLMAGMNEVGRLFGEGKMFLPQVVKTARTMKCAVEILIQDPSSALSLGEGGRQGHGTILLATVKGDVHDIGKNIVGVVLGCNGFEVIDLGVMVPTEQIISEATDRKVDIVCLSGLITPSLEEMCHVAQAMEEAGLDIPLFVGGATTSEIHTAVKIAPLYRGGVFHLRDASQNPVLAMQLLGPDREAVIAANHVRQQRIRLAQRQKEQRLALLRQTSESLGEPTPVQRRFACDWEHYTPVQPPFLGQQKHVPLPITDLLPLIDWQFFYWAWRVKPESEEAAMLQADAEALLHELAAGDASDPSKYDMQALTAFYPARGTASSIEVGVTSIPTPRQELITRGGKRREQCLALCDFVSPRHDYVGAFAVTVSPAFVQRLADLKAEGKDDYALLLLQTVGDRLAEAGAEYLSRELQTLTAEAGVPQSGWGGIRPAVGYPVLPDQKTIFHLAKMLDYGSIGITLTENGAMHPASSVSGLYISHPQATYFGL